MNSLNFIKRKLVNLLGGVISEEYELLKYEKQELEKKNEFLSEQLVYLKNSKFSA